MASATAATPGSSAPCAAAATTPRWRSSSSSEPAPSTPQPAPPASAERAPAEAAPPACAPAASASPQRPWSESGSPAAPRRVALCLQYDGAAFHGWQRQQGRISVQEVLEAAIAGLDPQRPLRCVAAGRTDSGVHAAGQVVHFDQLGPIPAHRWPKALNGRLPPSLRVLAAAAVPPDWHACFAARYRRYRYTILNARTPNLFLAPWSWHRYQWRLDEQAMAEALQGMLGHHDFSAFRRAGSRRSHSRTTLQQVQLERQGDLVVAEIQASGFLYGMVRLLMGQLVAVGEGRLSPEAFSRRWRSGARHEVKEAAPPQGLCLLRVGYERELFPEAAWYDSQPRFQLKSSDPPPAIPQSGEGPCGLPPPRIGDGETTGCP